MDIKNIGKYIIFIAILIVLSIFIPELGLISDPQDNTSGLGDLDVYFIDVGQGDSIFINTPKGNTILIDGGEPSQGETVLNFLKERGIENLDVVIATHAHADHIGGLIKVVENINIDAIYMPKASHDTKTFERFVLAVREKGLRFKPAYAGVDIPLEDVKAEFVAPAQKESYDDLNNSSAVLKLRYGNISFLFTGDAELESEEEMLSGYRDLKARVLKVGHHGSNTSTSEDFLKAVSPEYAVISCAKENRYGHPHDEVVERLKSQDITIYRTDVDGTVHIICDGKQVEIK